MEMQVLVELTKDPTLSVERKILTAFSLNLAYATLYSNIMTLHQNHD